MTLGFWKRATQLGSVVDRKFTIHNKMLFVQHALTLLKTTFFFFVWLYPNSFPIFSPQLKGQEWDLEDLVWHNNWGISRERAGVTKQLFWYIRDSPFSAHFLCYFVKIITATRLAKRKMKLQQRGGNNCGPKAIIEQRRHSQNHLRTENFGPLCN